jgi:hypothetical protein
MVASIVSKVSQLVRNTVRCIGTLLRRNPWLAPVAIVAVFWLV